ncbi:MAG: 6-carboxytetrahydropterin synthase QueD [Planctomycetota bacterium]
MKVRLTRTFEFHAAHSLSTFPEGHKCRNVHGHAFHGEIVVEGEVDPAKGYFVDFGDLKAALKPIEDELDHAYLNDIAGLEVPTVEMVCKWVWDRLKPGLPELKLVRIEETAKNAAEYWGE